VLRGEKKVFARLTITRDPFHGRGEKGRRNDLGLGQ